VTTKFISISIVIDLQIDNYEDSMERYESNEFYCSLTYEQIFYIETKVFHEKSLVKSTVEVNDYSNETLWSIPAYLSRERKKEVR